MNAHCRAVLADHISRVSRGTERTMVFFRVEIGPRLAAELGILRAVYWTAELVGYLEGRWPTAFPTRPSDLDLFLELDVESMPPDTVVERPS